MDQKVGYQEYPIAIVDRQVRQLRNKQIPMVKVLWNNHTMVECTWETEQDMKDRFPHLDRKSVV